MEHEHFGKILSGSHRNLDKLYNNFAKQAVDQDLTNEAPAAIADTQKTIARPVKVTGPGTFFGKAFRTLHFEPTNMEGWWFDRIDHPECLPVKVSIHNVWTTGAIVSNIVLRSGPPQNYIRLVEHIIALRAGMDIDNLMIRVESGDPPLFDKGSLDLVETLESAGRHEFQHPTKYFTVKEKVSLVTPEGKFLIFEPMDKKNPGLHIDCAIKFKNAIGRQRIQFPVNYSNFKYGSIARTNTSWIKKFYCQTIGRIFADIRNLGYGKGNVLIAGKFRYANKPRLLHEGKALEAVWHRATLDLLAAIALIEEGRFLGKVTSYKAGHALDVEMIRLLYQHDLIEEVRFDEQAANA